MFLDNDLNITYSAEDRNRASAKQIEEVSVGTAWRSRIALLRRGQLRVAVRNR